MLKKLLKSLFDKEKNEPIDEWPIDKNAYLKTCLDAGSRGEPNKYIHVLIKHMDETIGKMEIIQDNLGGEFPPGLLVSPDLGLFGIKQGDRDCTKMVQLSQALLYYVTIGLTELRDYPTTQLIPSPYNLRTYLRSGEDSTEYCRELLAYLRTLRTVVNRFREGNNYYCFMQLRNHLYLYLHVSAIVEEVVNYHRKKNTWMDYFPTFN